MILSVDHVAVAVRRIEERIGFWETLGLARGREVQLPGEGARVLFLPAGNSRVELLEPMGTGGPVKKFLDRRGEGIHHLCLRVDSVERTVLALEKAGFPAVGPIRKGADRSAVAFLDPHHTGGVLVELAEGDEHG